MGLKLFKFYNKGKYIKLLNLKYQNLYKRKYKH